jgi:hypothetical protein
MSAPITPPAPPRLSTTTGLPSLSESFCAIVRAVKSVPPPAANGTINRIGFVGNSTSPAVADPAAKASRAHTPATVLR